MKRIIVFVVVGLVMFGAGFGGGLMLGRTMVDNLCKISYLNPYLILFN